MQIEKEGMIQDHWCCLSELGIYKIQSLGFYDLCTELRTEHLGCVQFPNHIICCKDCRESI